VIDIISNNQLSIRGQLLPQESLAKYVSWRAGGPADYVYIPADLDDLSQFLKQLPNSIPLTWLGLGSNTLIRDGGIDGVVIITQGMLNKLVPLNAELIRANKFYAFDVPSHHMFNCIATATANTNYFDDCILLTGIQ